MKKRKQTRLDGFEYKQNYTYHVIICTKDKQLFFKNKDNARELHDIVNKEDEINSVNIYAHSVMYDHIHILINLQEEYKKKLSEWVRDFKRLVSRRLKKINLWQKNYYDHIMRTFEDIKQTALYIVNNPVRKGYVENWEDYEFSGINYKDE
ncbi:MAG: transposase [Candidatus Omnitrophica bacterium]|nr:transposase [Candidatus Omnitrophota bacterium]